MGMLIEQMAWKLFGNFITLFLCDIFNDCTNTLKRLFFALKPSKRTLLFWWASRTANVYGKKAIEKLYV